MVFPSFAFRKRNVLLFSLLVLFSLTTQAQSFSVEREVHTGWTLKFELDNKTHDTTINYIGSTGETLTVQNNYSDSENLIKSYSFNSGQAGLVIGSANGQRTFGTSSPSGFTENNGIIDFKEYQPLIDEYQTALFQTMIGLNSDRTTTIDLISMFYPHNTVNTRDGGAACASVVFAYITALINEEIQCSIPFNSAGCAAAVSGALGALAAVVAVCVDEDDDGDGDGGGDTGGGNGGGSGSGGSNPTTIEIQGGGSGDTGGDGGGFQCVYDGEAIVCTTHLN